MKKKILLLLVTVAATMLVLAGCADISDRTNPEFGGITNSGMIQMMDTMDYDWGDVNIAGGYATHDFMMKNDSDVDLYLKGAATSCMCTTAEIELPDGTTSPKFGMHNNPMDWVYAVKPGEEFTIHTVFDPMAHGPQAVGPIQRSVVLITSSEPSEIAKENFQEKRGTVTGFSLKGNVLSKEDFESMHEVGGNVMEDGGMMSDEDIEEAMDAMMGDHDDDEYDDLPAYEISVVDLMKSILGKKNIKIVDVREDSEAKDTGVIEGAIHLPVGSISMDAMTKNGLSKDDQIVVYCASGNRSRQAYELLTTLGYTNVKSMHGGLTHWVEDKLPVVKWKALVEDATTEQKKNSNLEGAKITFDRDSEDMGIVSPKAVTKTIFIVKNEGTKTLEIGTISTSCGCTSAEIANKSIEPGKSTEMVVTFDPTVHEEPKDKFKRTVFLETNDPNMPEASVNISVDIDESKM
ncbi:MAG: DUF1573 domain-containing protein [Candidatus Peregrinibacteria bacterium]|nr:DUF1573 domain-containing protein [Candidatus Peregrinibacteria bacterium]MDZ4244929.1 DUF1573 domain-containing protein [Candidatus Gracilibacteria bacterium]